VKKLFYTVALLLSVNTLALSFFDAGESATGVGDAGIAEALETDLKHDIGLFETEVDAAKNELRKIEDEISSSKAYKEASGLAHHVESKIHSGYEDAKNFVARAGSKIESDAKHIYGEGKRLAQAAGSRVHEGYEKAKEHVHQGVVKTEQVSEGLWAKIKAFFGF
jgi:uncharacterized protein YjbJ (UPF0337 family)